MKNKKLKRFIAAIIVVSMTTIVIPSFLKPIPAYAISMTTAQANPAGFFFNIKSQNTCKITRYNPLAPSPVSETYPAAVKIVGTAKAGNTLSAELLDDNDDLCITSLPVTYKWYRLDNMNSALSNQIGTGETYTLTDTDAGKYIFLVTNCGGNEFSA